MESVRTLALAKAGDEQAFRELTELYRAELSFEGRSSLRTWLHRIAANGCLNALRDRGRRPQEVPLVDELARATRRADPVWAEPYPDVLLDGLPDLAPGPEARYDARESIELAFVTALQHLPPRQRAVLVLRDVLGYPAAEVAAMLDSTEASVKGALQRARAALQARLPADRERAPRPDSPEERRLAGRFADAVEVGDVDAVVSLLTSDAWFTMPPEPYEYQGLAAIAALMHHHCAAPLRLVPTRANGQPAFGCYLPGAQTPLARPYGLIVLTLRGDRICAATWFFDTSVFPYFGLPRSVRR